ncbi:DMT family transporter [Ascidiimonas aurantiaca]|uniref:DMT family transporter n=1 Tax=Ascidiimonas aurantiaca TaxID=1685432 RepID=UPI0030EDEF29
MLKDRLVNYLHLHFIVFIWGFTAILGALISLEAFSLVWYRMLLASVFIGAYLYIKKKSLKVPRSVQLGFLLAGVIIALHWVTFFAAIKVSNVSITLVMMSTGSFFTSIIEPFWYKRKMIWYEVVFGLIVIFGVYLIFKVERGYEEGMLLALVSAFLAAVFNLLNGRFVQRYNPTVISFYELSSGTLFLTVFLFISGGLTGDLFQITTSDWGYLLLLAIVCTAYAFIASVKVMKYISPYTVMLTINLEPVYGILLAFFILGESEKMNPGFYLGALIIVIMVIANGVLKNFSKQKVPL